MIQNQFKFDFDFVMIQIGVPFERDPDTDIVRINNVPGKLKPIDQTYKME